MPLYEYECQQCRRHTEKRQKFSDVEITVCPHCGGHLQRVITAPAIAFRGGGWYADGYGNAKPKPSADGGSGENKGSAEGKSSGEGKSESGSSDSASKSPSSGDSSSSPSPAAPPPSSTAPASPPASTATKS